MKNHPFLRALAERVLLADGAIGTELMVDGSSVSFYIPRTGLEVVPTDKGYVRRAWRLRRSMGLHLRVVKPFVAKEGGAIPAGNYLAGQELLLRDHPLPLEEVLQGEEAGLGDEAVLLEHADARLVPRHDVRRHAAHGRTRAAAETEDPCPDDPARARVVRPARRGLAR